MQPSAVDIVFSFVPILLVFALIYLMWRVLNGPGSPVDRQAKALERIAAALEKRGVQ